MKMRAFWFVWAVDLVPQNIPWPMAKSNYKAWQSRFVKEKSKIPITVTWEGGIEKWSGLLDVALEGGYVIKPKNGWYQAKNPATSEELSGNVRAKQTLNAEFWEHIFSETDFIEWVQKRFKVAHSTMLEKENESNADDG